MSDASGKDPRIEVEGNEFRWAIDRSLLLIGGGPSLAIWIESSLAGLMSGMQQMVGTERFNLAMQVGGRESVEGDWAFISQHPSVEEGFARLARLAFTCGWGLWTMESLDREAKVGRFRVDNSWECLYQQALGVCWGSHYIGGKFAGHCGKIFGVHCWAEQTMFQAAGDECDAFEVTVAAETVEDRLARLLTTDAATRADLAVALEKLRVEVESRRAAEEAAQERLALIDQLSTPIMEIWDGVLSLPVVGTLAGERAQTMMERLLHEIQRTRSRFALIDVTGVDTVDTATADALLRIAAAARLLGAECIITGVRPAVAQTMVGLDARFGHVRTMATVREGLMHCMAQTSARRG
jgi:rsbT co-antagonist protein RsbR